MRRTRRETRNRRITLVPVQLATLALVRDRRRRHLVALHDREYSELVGRDVTDLEALMRQSALLRAVPEARWAGLARYLARRPVRRHIDRARRLVQRARRGWDDTALWELDRHLCATLGAQLEQLADRAHGWPDHTYETFADWTDALRLNAVRLAAYGTRLGATGPVDEALDDRALRDAQTALVWVADNLASLWD
jgi:hypothetical protein